jgi:hypothetical protein
MNLVIDHVTVCGSNLERMRDDFAAVGLRTVYGGRHANGATHMDLLTFPDGSYIELIAPFASLAEAGGMMSGWAKLMEGDAGCSAWAVRSTDIHTETSRLRSAGIEVRGPEAGGRQRTDDTKLGWETAIVGPGAAGSVLPFLIEDKTPRELRVPTPSAASEIEGVAAVVIDVRNLNSSIDLFRRAYDLEEAMVEDDPSATLAHFPETPIMLASPRGQKTLDARRIQRFGECPTAFLLKPVDFPRAVNRFELKDRASWFGRDIAWFDSQRLGGTRLGLVSNAE